MLKQNAPWTFSEQSRNVHRLEVTIPRVGDEFFALLCSDFHWDNPHTQLDTAKRLFDKAKERNAPIFDIGDFHCAMQGKWDKRSSKSDIKPEHNNGHYLDALVSTAADWLEPYASLMTLRGYGNHETGIKKHHETDLVDRLTERLKAMGSPACTGGYSGFVRIMIKYKGTRSKSIKYWYHHGHGGGGPVTRGVIQTNRHAVYLPDADIVHTGHTHDAWIVPIARTRLSDSDRVEHCRQVHVSTPGMKEEYGDGHGGWHIERGGPPKPIGFAWLRIYQEQNGVIDFEITEAR